MVNVDSSKIKPSLKLQDSINSLINKNDFFNLIDQQVLVYDKIFSTIKNDNFEISWNLGQGQTFVIDDSINEAGCIHSVQGLEFDYVGVLIGKDLRFDNKVIADYNFHGTADPSFKGIKKIRLRHKNRLIL